MSTTLTFASLVPTLLSLIIFSFLSCSDDSSSSSRRGKETYKVAVLCESYELKRWERTAQWAMQNIATAQQGLDTSVELQLLFYDQNAADIANKMLEIATDTTIVAVIGPTTSSTAEEMVKYLVKHPKPMLTPSATNVDYQRTVSKYDFVWNMAESDIAEMEALLASCAGLQMSNIFKVKLLAPKEGEGHNDNPYADWFGFLAEEYGFTVGDIMLYRNEEEVREYVRAIAKDKFSMQGIFFCPNSVEVALALDDELGKLDIKSTEMIAPYFYCTDAFINEHIISNIKNYSYEGVDLYAAPETGFQQAYMQHFDDDLINGEAQFYDAINLLAYAATLKRATGKTLNQSILDVTNGGNGPGATWLPADMTSNFQRLANGETPDLNGVSSDWSVDDQTHSYFTGSTYRHWRCDRGRTYTMDYISTQGSPRSSSSKDMWEWQSTKLQEFSPTPQVNITYPELHDCWALLIAGSSGWGNYRFQADVYAMYQILKNHGYDDDHIILIAEDDVANNPRNTLRPDLRINDDGPNLYDPNALDYKLSDIRPADLADILQGKKSLRLSKVISSTPNDNVFIFWSGHGTPGSMDFDPSNKMTYSRMKDILAATPHRKMLVVVEACYSGGLGLACQGIPGTLFITAASPSETSHAAVMSNLFGIYLSNSFTRGFQLAIENFWIDSLRDIYVTLARNTSGSHVKIYNDNNYGSIYRESLTEFLDR